MILFLSAYPPRQSGLASYTYNLLQAFGEHFDPGTLSVEVGALEEAGAEKRLYGEEVRYTLQTADAQACRNLAYSINQDHSIRAVCIQHRFGLWGGSRWGDNILLFLDALEKPLAVMLHNVLPEPEAALSQLVQTIARRADVLLTHCRYHKELLLQYYSVAADKLRVIAPGVAVLPPADKERLKEKYNLRGRLVLTSIGSLRRSKGIEQVLEALDEIRKEHPSVIYLILGPTHPAAARHEGERYRFQVKDFIFRKGLQKHVAFLNRNLKEEEFQEYLSLTDVYLHLSKNNAPGLLQAMSLGCPVIATPSPITREFIPREAGVVVEAVGDGQLATLAKTFLSNENLRQSKSKAARAATRQYYWPNVAIAYQDIFAELTPLHTKFRLPCINASYLHRYTSSFGLQHLPAQEDETTKATYLLEGNARALLAALQLQLHHPGNAHLKLMHQYLNMIKRCQQPDGSFLNGLQEGPGNGLAPAQQTAPEEAAMQTLWALGALLKHQQQLPADIPKLANRLFQKALLQLEGLQSLRAISFAIKGLYCYQQAQGGQATVAQIDALAARLQDQFTAVASKDWPWFEKGLSQANTLYPEALMLAWAVTGKGEYKRTAQRAFGFLLTVMFMEDPLPGTGSPDLQLGSEERFGFSNLPQDVTEAITTLDLFYELSGEELYLDKMRAAFSWFLGNNHLRQSLYNAATGSCCDGLEGRGLRQRHGTESLVNYLLARLSLEKHALQFQPRDYQAPEHKLAQDGSLAVAPDRPSIPSGNVRVVVK
jgi:glycosyltransferase involved in cell wall biosynthesis